MPNTTPAPREWIATEIDARPMWSAPGFPTAADAIEAVHGTGPIDAHTATWTRLPESEWERAVQYAAGTDIRAMIEANEEA